MPQRRRRFARRLCRHTKSAPPALLGQSNKRKLWTNEQMLAALKAVEEGQPITKLLMIITDSGRSKLPSKTAGISCYQNSNIYTPEESSQ